MGSLNSKIILDKESVNKQEKFQNSRQPLYQQMIILFGMTTAQTTLLTVLLKKKVFIRLAQQMSSNIKTFDANISELFWKSVFFMSLQTFGSMSLIIQNFMAQQGLDEVDQKLGEYFHFVTMRSQHNDRQPQLTQMGQQENQDNIGDFVNKNSE